MKKAKCEFCGNIQDFDLMHCNKCSEEMPFYECNNDKIDPKNENYVPLEIDANSSEEQISTQIENHIMTALEYGCSNDTIIKDLISNGITKKDAKLIIEETIISSEKKFKKRATIEIAVGVGVLYCGAIYTGISYSVAENGGTYAIATGAFLFGAISIFHGGYKIITGKSIRRL